MKLIKSNEQHYIVVDDSEIKDVRPYKGRWHYEKGVAINQFPTYLTDLSECKLITHSFGQHLEGVINKPLSEVEEAINGYSVEKMAEHSADDAVFQDASLNYAGFYKGYINGFNAHKELVKDKLFTIEDIEKAIKFGSGAIGLGFKSNKEFIQSLLPKTEWDVTFDEQGKLKLI